MAVLLVTHERYLDHDAGRSHPERPARLEAVLAGVTAAGLGEALVPVVPAPASRGDLERVHTAELLDSLAAVASRGGGRLDPDTAMSADSLDAALLGSGAGLTAIGRLDAGEATAAFCVVRPPGHHATRSCAMGFCLVNHIAVAAAALAERGERVLVVDIDAHHGNGTQDVFYGDPRVAYVSLHQYPLYPGTGSLREVGEGDGFGTTVNLPVPAGATGDVYQEALDRVVLPFAADWRPTWLLISAGFDTHRADPLTDLHLSAGDVADLATRLLPVVPPGRRLAFLEGGYDLQALADCSAAFVGSLADAPTRPEPATSGGPGLDVVHAAALVRSELLGAHGTA
jgi:acetoin utilization deacetylase AcuC-like enzyme